MIFYFTSVAVFPLGVSLTLVTLGYWQQSKMPFTSVLLNVFSNINLPC